MLKQGHLEVVARVMSSCVFSKDGEPTNYLPGQSVSMLSHPCSKNGFLMFRGNLCFCLCPLPLALSLVTRAFSLHPSFRHLYTLMRSLWAFFSPRWTVPALPDMLQYLSPSQWSFARIHTVVSFLPLRGNTSLPFPVPEMPMPPSQAKCSNHYWGTRAHMLTCRWWPQVQEDRAGRSPGLGCKKQLQTRVLTAEHTNVTVQDYPLSDWLTCSPIIALFQHLTTTLSLLVDWEDHQCHIASRCPHSFPFT